MTDFMKRHDRRKKTQLEFKTWIRIEEKKDSTQEELIPVKVLEPFPNIEYFSTPEFRKKVVDSSNGYHPRGIDPMDRIRYWRKRLEEDSNVMIQNPVLVTKDGFISDGNHRLIVNRDWSLSVFNSQEGWYSCPKCKVGKSYVEAKIMCVEPEEEQPFKTLIILRKDENIVTEGYTFRPTEERPLLQDLRLMNCSDCGFQFVITGPKKKKD
jgi:hypothetical protein